MTMRLSVALYLCISLLLTGVAGADEHSKFPHREKFKSVKILEIDQLRGQIDNFNVVDVRSKYEYQTLHIKNAVHIALNKEKLPAAVRDLQSKSTKPVVFYCNGTTCKKSYEAAEMAMQAGIVNVFAYDAGLEAWTKKYPDMSVLLGKSPVDPSELISKEIFSKHVINAQEFEDRLGKGAVVLDIRDLRQRDIALFPMRELRAPLDDSLKITNAVSEAKKSRKTLLVYDKVGKQTRWFQYYLEKQGIKDYYFLDGGSEGYHEAKFGKLNFKVPEQG